jgi:tetratricopeptide (TPR) repeat protein
MNADLKSGTLLAALLMTIARGAPSQDLDHRIRQLDAEARAEERQGHPEAAIQNYREILKLNSKLPAVYNDLGRLYYEKGQFQEALDPLKRAAELDPGLEAPKALMGFCLYQMGDFAGARQKFQSALRLKPGDGAARLYLARSLMELQDAKGALKLLEQLQQEDPQNVEVLFSLGWLHAGLAVSTLDAIQRIDPNSYLTELLQGKYSETKQVYPEAAEHYKKAIEKSPNQPELHYCYAHVLYASGEFQPALQEYRHVLEMNPYDYRASWEAARIVLPDDPQEAYRLANRALELKRGAYGALTIRGRALLALGKPSEAIEDFKQAAAMNPQDASIHFQLARAYGKLGMTQQEQAETAIYDRIQSEAHSPTAREASALPQASPATP